MLDARLGRRAFVVTSLSLGAAGCFGGDPEPTAAQLRDRKIRRGVLRSERHLIARYEATEEHHPELAGVLAQLRREHESHLHAIARRETRPGDGASPGRSPGQSPGQSPPPATPEQALRALVKAEEQASDERMGDVLTASPLLARLVAGIGAAEAGHAEFLRGAGT
ncbi:MAG: ferritin-like domain-containing protein [Streptomycetales bacterium]